MANSDAVSAYPLHVAAPFEFLPLPCDVTAGAGRLGDLPAILNRIGARTAMLLGSRSGLLRHPKILDTLSNRCVAVFNRAEAHCPEPLAIEALTAFIRSGAEAIVSLGGGSPIGIGKYIQVATGRPFVCIPTTLSGSEMTALYGLRVEREKRSKIDRRAVPRAVIYDPELLVTLPMHETLTTGANCMAHCIEALYPVKPSPIASALALEGIRTLVSALRAVKADLADLEARSACQYASMLGGLVVSMVGIGLHHKLCHVVGGLTGAPHGEANCVLLPHIVAFNLAAVPRVAKCIGNALGSDRPAAALFELIESLGGPLSLRDIGLREEDLGPIARDTIRHVTPNPRAVDICDLERILTAAWVGRPPD